MKTNTATSLDKRENRSIAVAVAGRDKCHNPSLSAREFETSKPGSPCLLLQLFPYFFGSILGRGIKCTNVANTDHCAVRSCIADFVGDLKIDGVLQSRSANIRAQFLELERPRPRKSRS